jgi:hypothetical protein
MGKNNEGKSAMCERLFFVAVGAFSVAISGCAHAPDVSINYHLTQTKVSVRVLRTIACDAANNPIIANATTPSAHHFADATNHSLSLSALKGPFSDSDIKVELTDDARIKAINATSTGQGEVILKSFLTLASTVVARTAKTGGSPQECKDIKDFGGGKPLTIAYEGEIDLVNARLNTSQPIAPDATSAGYAAALSGVLGSMCVTATKIQATTAPASKGPKVKDLILKARQPGVVNLEVTTGIGGCSATKVWSGQVPVAQFGIDYDLPIPKPAAFGKQTFAASFSDSGALSSLQYVTGSGEAQAANTIGSLVTALRGDTTTQKLAEVRAEADLIAQQQRLVQCLADRTACK